MCAGIRYPLIRNPAMRNPANHYRSACIRPDGPLRPQARAKRREARQLTAGVPRLAAPVASTP
eukprot:11604301-Alexandrium_andersonii.AAC.1